MQVSDSSDPSSIWARSRRSRPALRRHPRLRARAGVLFALCLVLALPASASAHKMVALTFDDGPSRYTDDVLRELNVKSAPATFFVVGKNLSTHGSVLTTMELLGHEIGNHTWSHPFLTQLSSEAIRHELLRTNRAVKGIVEPVGGTSPSVFRPPYGDVDRRVRAIARELELRTVLWDVDPWDWSRPGTRTIVRRVVHGVGEHSIVLLHDGGGPREQTVAAVPRIIRELRERGYQLVTVSQFFEAGGYSGEAASSAKAAGFEPEPRRAYEGR
jgi:peptidoglycan-N-acetylglucosamine deacetylase